MPEVVLTRQDPRDPDAIELAAELSAFLTDLYPEDVDDPPSPWGAGDIVRAGTFIVACVDGEPAGCGGLTPVGLDGALEVIRMYVRPGHRGQRIADRILSELEAFARQQGVSRIVLRCGPRQPEALRVYERNGYVPRAVFAHHREHPTNVFYEKAIKETVPSQAP